MGTYIYIRGNFTIKKNQIQPAIEAIKALNSDDSLKRGGGMNGKWFAWCPEDYDKTVETLEDIFGNMLGFDMNVVSEDDEKIEYYLTYSDKWGQHEIFFVTLGPFCEAMVVDHNCDELEYEDQRWIITLNQRTKTVHQLIPTVTVTYPPADELNVVTVRSYVPSYVD